MKIPNLALLFGSALPLALLPAQFCPSCAAGFREPPLKINFADPTVPPTMRPASISIPEDQPEGVSPPTSPFKPYSGDVFGTQGAYLGGMVYLSRMKIVESPKTIAEREKEEARKLLDGRDEDDDSEMSTAPKKSSKLSNKDSSPNDLPTSSSNTTTTSATTSATSLSSSSTLGKSGHG